MRRATSYVTFIRILIALHFDIFEHGINKVVATSGPEYRGKIIMFQQQFEIKIFETVENFENNFIS